MISLPIRIISGDNNHKSWRSKAKRNKAHRAAGFFAVPNIWRNIFPAGAAGGLTVTLTRVAPRELDDDGLASGLKSVRDGIADGLGLKSDNDPRVTWKRDQRRGGVREYAVEISIAPRKHCPTCGAVT